MFFRCACVWCVVIPRIIYTPSIVLYTYSGCQSKAFVDCGREEKINTAVSFFFFSFCGACVKKIIARQVRLFLSLVSGNSICMLYVVHSREIRYCCTTAFRALHAVVFKLTTSRSRLTMIVVKSQKVSVSSRLTMTEPPGDKQPRIDDDIILLAFGLVICHFGSFSHKQAPHLPFTFSVCVLFQVSSLNKNLVVCRYSPDCKYII